MPGDDDTVFLAGIGLMFAGALLFGYAMASVRQRRREARRMRRQARRLRREALRLRRQVRRQAGAAGWPRPR